MQNNNLQKRIKISTDVINEFCKKNHISKLAFFGSILTNDFNKNSDIDILVEFEPGNVPGFGFIRLQRELSQMLGHEVDLNTPKSLSKYFRDEVVANSEVLYAKE